MRYRFPTTPLLLFMSGGEAPNETQTKYRVAVVASRIIAYECTEEEIHVPALKVA